MTVYDKINKMSDEELARVLASIYMEGKLTCEAVHYDLPDPTEDDIKNELNSPEGYDILTSMLSILRSEVSTKQMCKVIK